LLKSGSYFGFDLPSGNFVALMGRVTCEVDPIDGTTGTGFLVGSSAVPIC
jgi:hypothetical protein